MASKDKAAERKTGVAAWNESRGNNTQRPEGGKAARQRKAEADKRDIQQQRLHDAPKRAAPFLRFPCHF